MADPTIDDVASMSGEDFANFAATFDANTQTGEPTLAPQADAVPPTEPASEEDVAPAASESSSEEATLSDMSPEDFYTAIVAPMRAKGKEVAFTDPEEIRTLIQKGIGYEQNMGKVKKYQRHIEALDKEGLMNEDTLNLIIDLAKGKPEALKQYITNNKIDVYDMIVTDSEGYKPENHITSEEEFEHTEMVQEIKSYDGYDLIQPIVETDWDKESQDKVLADPALAKHIIAAAKAGIHDMVLVEAEKVKLLASQPMSDLDAYVAAGNKLHKKGAFDKISQKTSNVDEKIMPKNIATNSRKPTTSTGTPSMEEISKMSPEELRKFAAKHDI